MCVCVCVCKMSHEVYECTIQSDNIYIFQFKNIQKLSDTLVSQHLDIFCKSLKTISCFPKTTVIMLDCSLVSNVKFAKKILKVGFNQFKQLQRGYIEKLIIISCSKIINAAVRFIVTMKNASSYTAMVSTIEEANKLLGKVGSYE